MIRRKNKSRFLLIGSFLVFIGLSIFASYNIYNYYSNKKDEKTANNFIEDLKSQKDNNLNVDNIEVDNKSNNKIENKNNYIGVLEIPTIDFKRGFFFI